MHPGVLVADIGHLEQIPVQAAGLQGLHEHRGMGFRTAGGDDHPIQLVLEDLILDLGLGILAAGEEVVVDKDYARQGCRIFLQAGNIDDAGDIGAAVADKDADPRFQAGDVDLFRNHPFLGVRSPCRGYLAAGKTRRGAGFGHRSGDILRSLEGAAGEDARP